MLGLEQDKLNAWRIYISQNASAAQNRPLASPGNVCDSRDTESLYTIHRNGVNPGSTSGGLAIQCQHNQIY